MHVFLYRAKAFKIIQTVGDTKASGRKTKDTVMVEWITETALLTKEVGIKTIDMEKERCVLRMVQCIQANGKGMQDAAKETW